MVVLVWCNAGARVVLEWYRDVAMVIQRRSRGGPGVIAASPRWFCKQILLSKIVCFPKRNIFVIGINF